MALQKFGKYKKQQDIPNMYKTLEDSKKTMEKSKATNPYNTNYTDPIAEYEAKKRPLPQYSNQAGEVNEQYKSGRGANALSGLAIGTQAGQGRDNIFGISSAVGGLVAGLFSKNLAGKQKYKQDVEQTEVENQALYNETNASLRLKAYAEEEARKKSDQILQENKVASDLLNAESRRKRDDNAIKISQNKDVQAQRKEIQGFINTTTGEDRKFWQQKMNESTGYNNQDEDAYVMWETEKTGGDLLFKKNKAGEYQVAEDGKGNDISTLSTPQQIDALTKAKKLEPKDRMKAEDAWDRANEALKARGVDKQFTNPKTKASQYNALVMKMAGEIIDADSKQEKGASTYFRVDGVPYKLDLPILGQTKVPETPVSGVGAGESPFMPNDIGQPPKMVDATQNPVSTTPKTVESTVTPPNQFDYQSWKKTVKNPKAEISSLVKNINKLEPVVSAIAKKYGVEVDANGEKRLKGTPTPAEQQNIDQYTDYFNKYETLSPPPPPKQTPEERAKIEKEALENDYKPVPPKDKRRLMPEGMIHTQVINGRLVKVKRVGKKLVEVVDK